MRIFLIAFLLALTAVGESKGENECPRYCHGLPNPLCGYDEGCNFHGINWCYITIEECWRSHRSMPSFKFIREGQCPNDKPSCPSSRLPLLDEETVDDTTEA